MFVYRINLYKFMCITYCITKGSVPVLCLCSSCFARDEARIISKDFLKYNSPCNNRLNLYPSCDYDTAFLEKQIL